MLITARAGERTRIIRRISNSVPASYRFLAEPLDAGKDVSGTVEVKGSAWLFPKAAARQKLQRENSVEKGAWDTLYSVYVIPDADVKITLSGARRPQVWIYIVLAIIVLAVVSSAIPYFLNL